MSSMRQAGALEQALGGVDRAGEHQHRVDADEAGVDDAGLGREPERRRPCSAVISSTAAAPSEICDEEPAVCTPSSRATGFSVGQRLERGLAQALVAADVVRGAGGLAVVVEVGRVDRRRSGRRSGPRPTPGRRAAASARPKRVGVGAGDAPLVGDALGALELRRHLVVAEVRLRDRACRGRASSATPTPIGTRLIASTPHARATSTTPAPTSDVARLVACCDDPHWVSTVVAATDSGQAGGQPRGAGDVERSARRPG